MRHYAYFFLLRCGRLVPESAEFRRVWPRTRKIHFELELFALRLSRTRSISCWSSSTSNALRGPETLCQFLVLTLSTLTARSLIPICQRSPLRLNAPVQRLAEESLCPWACGAALVVEFRRTSPSCLFFGEEVGDSIDFSSLGLFS